LAARIGAQNDDRRRCRRLDHRPHPPRSTGHALGILLVRTAMRAPRLRGVASRRTRQGSAEPGEAVVAVIV